MIAVQKPPSMFPSPAFRPTHARLPSAPIVVRPSHMPGVLNLAKPSQTSLRPQHMQPQSRALRVSPKSKSHRPIQPSPADVVENTKILSSSPSKTELSSTAADKPIRGRKQQKLKDTGRRENSASPSDVAARRHAHQPSPSRIPSPPKAIAATRAQVARVKPEDKTYSADPFRDDVDVSSQDPKFESKSFRSPPKLSSQPSGKLARRRQVSSQLLDSPTSKVASRRKSTKPGHELLAPGLNLSARPPTRRASTDLTIGSWDSFPVCDDSSEYPDDRDVTPPTTPIREISTGPSKAGPKGMWQQENLLIDDAPRTAPLAPTSGYPFLGPSPSTPTPVPRRRNHKRVPSEGVFAMSTDEESPSSSVSDLFESMHIKRRSPVSIPRQRCYTVPAGGSPSSLGVAPVNHIPSSSAPAAAGYFAGSVFQNSPSPDDLPAPSFAL